MRTRRTRFFHGAALAACLLFLTTCGQSEQTGVWIRIVCPEISITHAELNIYDLENISHGPVTTATVPDPPFQVPKKLFPTAKDEKNQLWVLILAGSDANRTVRVAGYGMLNDRKVAEGEIPRIEFTPGQILDGVDSEGRSLVLELRGCLDADGDSYCPPEDCDDANADINPAARELCDDLDNDCDMAVDEGCSCTGQGRQCRPQWIRDIDNLCTEDKDPRCPCKLGFQPCTGGTWGECEGMVPPEPEGLTTGEGGDEAGISCTAGCFDDKNEPVECGLNDFSCYFECFDGWDNDCDWRVDEKDIGCGGCNSGDDRACYEGQASTIGKGICKVGHQVCDDQGNWGQCTGAVYPEADPEGPEPECDGRDEDCDGTVDDGDEMCRVFPNAVGHCVEDSQSETGKACHMAGCEPGFDDCDGIETNGCEINLGTDADNCGACGFSCGDNAHCKEGRCECDMNRGDCNGDWSDGCEIDFLSDSAHCGRCDFACGRNAFCANGACACEAGFDNCNGDWSDGCETDLLNDPANCGSCDNECTNPHGTTSCSGGQCRPVCEGLWGDCNGIREDGCERTLNTVSDCGACGFACGPNTECSDGTCACVPGFADCNGGWSNGCETTLGTASNCRGCGDSCDDGNVCTNDYCISMQTGCGHENNNAPCDDGLFCNGTDTCSGGNCSVHSGDPCPGPDGDADCSETCNEATDSCTAPDPNGSVCDDGLWCNGTDRCSGGSCSQHTGDPCPGPDGDSNCSESCNEATDSCTAPDPNGSVCDDGLFCNGGDTCSGGSCSQHAGDPCSGPDGDADCSESCDEATDTCTAPDPNGSPCDDGLFCNGDETCSNGTCGNSSGDPCPGPDGDADCSESCRENNDTCTANDPNNSTCDDGDPCTTGDSCTAGICSGTPVDCGLNAHCNAITGVCVCDTGFLDCNGDGDCACDISTSICDNGSCVPK